MDGNGRRCLGAAGPQGLFTVQILAAAAQLDRALIRASEERHVKSWRER
jgi:hypothetical protein